jgi:PTS system ascorbate-specific IIA component
MIGVLLITHERLGEALLNTATHVLGRRPEQVSTIEVPAGTDPRDLVATAQSLLERLDSGNGVLILTDIFGASPSNLACRLAAPGKIEAVSGVNVPMILRAMSSRNQGMAHLLKRVVGGGCEGVFRIECAGVEGPRVSETLAGQLKTSTVT